MEKTNDENNLLFLKILENSLFTNRQIQIIYNIKTNQERPKEITSGAFYREVKQSRDKIKKVLYSVLLLQMLGIINNEQIMSFLSVIDKISMINNNHAINHNKDISSVINVIEQLIIKMINI